LRDIRKKEPIAFAGSGGFDATSCRSILTGPIASDQSNRCEFIAAYRANNNPGSCAKDS